MAEWRSAYHAMRHGPLAVWRRRMVIFALLLSAWGIACGDSGVKSDRDGSKRAGAFRTVPAEGATSVPVGIWPEIEFDRQEVADAATDPALRCDGQSYGPKIFRGLPRRLIVQPSLRLPEGQTCEVTWEQGGKQHSFSFETWSLEDRGLQESATRVIYRKLDPDEIAPIPDDFWTRRDESSPTGLRLDLPVAVRRDVREVLLGLQPELASLDGWSPVAPIVLELSGLVDAATLPRTAAESMDPVANLALVDIEPESPEYGQRWPFETVLRRDRTMVGLDEHSLWVLPARPLRPGGHYALLIRRGVSDPAGRSMMPPSLLTPILKRRPVPKTGLRDGLAKQLAPALRVAESELTIPWTRDDLVFALTFTVGTLNGIDRDPKALREDVEALSGPRLLIDWLEPETDPERPLMAVVEGRFKVPRWRGEGEAALRRDATGRPIARGYRFLNFRLALPWRADGSPAPVLIYQHGNPGNAETEIGAPLQDPFLEAGFAVIGFTDLWNRGISEDKASDRRTVITSQVLALTESVRERAVVPDDWIVTLGEQIALVAALRERSKIDVLPLGLPDGVPDLDDEAPLVYEGISQGAIHGQALLAYAPEIRAASLVAGGARLVELPLHQAPDTMVAALPFLFGDFLPIDLWVTMSLFQAAIDRQDSHLHALQGRLVRDGDEPVSNLSARRAPSVLLTAGVEDGFVPNRLTRSLAWSLGPLAWVGGPAMSAVGLPAASAPLRGNLSDGSTGAYVELVPSGLSEPAAPGCRPESLPLPLELLEEGHFCAQLAGESIRRRVTFLRSALGDAPPLVMDPFAGGGGAESGGQ